MSAEVFQSLVSRPASARRRIAAVHRVPEYLRGQLVFLQQVTKPQDGALVRRAHRPVVQPGKLAVQRHVVQRLLHRRVDQTKPLLQEMDAQHRLHRKRWAAPPCLPVRRARSMPPDRPTASRDPSLPGTPVRVRLVDRFSPRPVCLMDYLLAGSASACNHITRGFMQTFPSNMALQLPQITDPVSSYLLFNITETPSRSQLRRVRRHTKPDIWQRLPPGCTHKSNIIFAGTPFTVALPAPSWLITFFIRCCHESFPVWSDYDHPSKGDATSTELDLAVA